MRPLIGVLPAAGIASRLAPFGYPKELLPITYVADAPGGSLRPMPVIEASLRQLRTAGVGKALVVISDRKPELMRYLGHGMDADLDIAFLHQSQPNGLAAAVALAAPWSQEADLGLLLPDTVVRPLDALARVRKTFLDADADLVLGVFPTKKPQELGPVRFDAQGRVTEVQDKPAQTDLFNSWAMAVWSPRFTQLLSESVAAAESGLTLGAVFQRAVNAGMTVRALWFPDGQFLDLGTPQGLTEALPLIASGL